MEIIVGLLTGIVFFIVCFLGFKQGVRLGMQVAKGITPEPLKNPIQAVTDFKDSIQENKEVREEINEFAQMMAYTGDIPKGKG